MTYNPTFTITPQILSLVRSISEKLGALTNSNIQNSPELRKQNRIKTITGKNVPVNDPINVPLKISHQLFRIGM